VYLFIYLLSSVAYDREGWKNYIDYKTLQNSIYLLCEYSKRFVQPVVRPVVQPAANCKRTLTVRQPATGTTQVTTPWTIRKSLDWSGASMLDIVPICVIWAQLQFAPTPVWTVPHVWRTKRPSFAAVSVADRYEVGRDARPINASCNWVDLFGSGQLRSAHVCCEQRFNYATARRVCSVFEAAQKRRSSTALSSRSIACKDQRHHTIILIYGERLTCLAMIAGRFV